MFDGIAKHEGRNRDFFFLLRKCLIFLLFLFNLFLFNDSINKC